MTEHDHLDDDALSSVLDGGGGDGGAAVALASCRICATRLEALRGASRAMAAAQVPPLPAGVVDDLVARALAAPAEEPAVGPPAGAGAGAGVGGGRSPVRGRSRWHAPPPAWLLAAAAAIVVLVATAGLVRSGRGGDDRALSARTDAVDASGAASGSADGSGGGSLAANATATAGAPPPADAVTSDLGTVDDDDALVAALGPSLAAAPRGTAAAPAPAAGSSEPTSGGATAGEAAPDAPTAGSGTADRAQCRAQAERFGAGRLGPLASTHTVRWRGEPAEVLVFALAEPRDGLSREAVVLGRPGCSILADRRF